MTRLQDYFFELNKSFNYYHLSLLEEVRQDNIHKIRTILKKLKTFNILLDGLLFRKNDFPVNLLKLFKELGEIRDIQIQKSIIGEYEIPYNKYLDEIYKYKILNVNINDTYEDDLQYLSNKLNNIEDYHIDDQVILNIKARVEVGLDDIRSIVDGISLKSKSEDLHKIRINLKRLYYIILMLEDNNYNIDVLYNIQENIGLWHDYDVTIYQLGKMSDIKLYNNTNVIKILKKKRKKLYKNSTNLLKDYFLNN
jgi:CHAD domain-containing protein